MKSANPFAFCAVLLLLFCGPGLPLPAARASWGENYGSVHFNSGEPDFGTPPRRAVFPGQDSRPNRGGGSLSDKTLGTEFDLIGEREAHQARRRAALHQEWEAALASGKWRQAKAQIEQEVRTFGVTGSLRDRMEVLAEAAKRGGMTPALVRALRTYFWGLRVSDQSPQRYAEAGAAFQKLRNDAALPEFLRAHSAYQIASLFYQQKSAQAARLFRQMATDFPHSPKKPAALLMAARTGLLLPADPNDPNAREAAKKALDELRRDFPNRYSRPVQGLYGRYFFLNGNYGKAADIYFNLNDWVSLQVVRRFLPLEKRRKIGPRLLAAFLIGMDRATTYPAYLTALKGVDREMQELTPAGAHVFVGRLMREPDLAAPYFYYRLYYTDTAFTGDDSPPLDESARRARARIAASRRNLLDLARRISAGSGAGKTRLSAPVRLRLAEVFYQEGRYPEALQWVQTVSRFPVPPAKTAFVGAGGLTTDDRALYVRGAIFQKMKRNRAAARDFERLLAHYPRSFLRSAAREELAVLYEAVSRNDAALDQYFALGYAQDVAYLLDVRMTTGEVAAYRSSHLHHPKAALITYSLGVRYLRDDNLTLARRTFQRLSRKEYAALVRPKNEWGNTFDDGSDPLRVVDALVTLRQDIARARTSEARATALYRHASYHYKNGLLLFYNAALWGGDRVFDFDVFWNRRQMTPADRAAVRRHMYRHEVYIRVIDQCCRIADRYPDTSAAPLALYRAACAADHLAGMNQWWQSEENHRHFEAQAAGFLRRLGRRYPRHPLGHNARKYAHVFADEDREFRKAWAEAQKNPKEKERETALAY